MRRVWGRTGRWLLTAVAAMAVLATGAQAAPPGDNRAEALPLVGPLPIEVNATNVGATKDTSDSPGDFAAGHSVWFKWKATTAGWVSIGACNSDFPLVLGVFEENEFGFLVPAVAKTNANEGPGCPFSGRQYTFRPTSGKEYLIGVDGNAFYPPLAPKPVTEGIFALRIEATPPPANDDFAAAAPVLGTISEEPSGYRLYFGGVNGYNWGATKQPGEPDHGGDPGGASVWYAWTAPESAEATVSACCAGVSIIGIYSGSSIGSLVSPPSNPSSSFVDLPVSAGSTYLIAVDGRRSPLSGEPAEFGFRLQVTMRLPVAPVQLGQYVPPAVAPPRKPAPPRTIFVKRSVDPDEGTVTFVFKSSASGSRYRCKLDSGKFKPCRSPKTYRHLTAGRHVFRVVAVDGGVADPTPLVARLSLPKR